MVKLIPIIKIDAVINKIRAQFKFSVASPRGANQKMVQHDTG